MLSKPGVLPNGDATADEFLHKCLTLNRDHLKKMLPGKFLEYFAFCLAMDGLTHGRAREELLPGVRDSACRECHTKKPNEYAALLLSIFSDKPEDKIKAAFKNARKTVETAAAVPLESIVLETDCPYLAPEPMRGKENHSGLIRFVAEKLGEVRGLTAQEILRITEANARRLFFERG